MRKNNKPYDLRLDIPARAFINSIIIHRMQVNPNFSDIKKEVLKELSLTNSEINLYHLLDQSHVASLLYCIIVVPKEVMNLSKNDMLFKEIDKIQPFIGSYFSSLQITGAEVNAYWIIRLLRHSVSHALYIIDADNNWDFWTDKPPALRASIKRDKLMDFLNVCGRALTNRMLKLKNE